MNYRHLGKSGLQISELSFGSWVTFHNQVDVDATVSMMAAGYDAGMNFFDNAEVYAGGKSEEVMGEADDSRVEKLISRLRRKVEPLPGRPQYIRTVRGHGYRFVP